jgi:hypothetical protein
MGTAPDHDHFEPLDGSDQGIKSRDKGDSSLAVPSASPQLKQSYGGRSSYNQDRRQSLPSAPQAEGTGRSWIGRGRY